MSDGASWAEAPLPSEMQGRWIDAEDPSSVLLVDGGEVTCFGEAVDYDYKVIDEDDGAVTVSLKVNDGQTRTASSAPTSPNWS